MNKNRTQQQLYIVFWIVIVVLIGLIGWFTYLLVQPNDAASDTATDETVTTNSTTTTNTDKKKKKAKNANSAETNTNTDAANTTDTADTTDDTDETNTNADTDGGLVEPTDETTDATNANAEADTADDDTQVVTLYFPKADSACGVVYPVERNIEPVEDIYGQIILETMHGPSDDDAGYSNAIPSGMYLRQVEYTADGAVITVSEAYDNLDSCDQETAAAQLIETANAMFELPEGAAGEVVVGTVSDDDENTTDADTTEDAE